MDTKVVYQTDHLGIYTGKTVADRSPLEPDAWLIPGGCVEVAPPTIAVHQAARWNGKEWKLIESYQGEIVYHKLTGQPLLIETPEPLPKGYTLKAPGEHQVWNKSQWVDDVPARAKIRYADQLAAINMACEQTITGGFYCDVLDEPHRYDSTLIDQVNLTSQVVLGNDGHLACRDAQGVKSYREHTAEQLHLVSAAFNHHRLTCQQKALSLKDRLDAALTANDLAAIDAASWAVGQA
ncbi:MAG: phage tail protein [Pseudomonadota bacterium]